jgi:hypothetical protein
MLVIPDTWDAEIERIMVEGQPRQKANEMLSEPTSRDGGVCL